MKKLTKKEQKIRERAFTKYCEYMNAWKNWIRWEGEETDKSKKSMYHNNALYCCSKANSFVEFYGSIVLGLEEHSEIIEIGNEFFNEWWNKRYNK